MAKELAATRDANAVREVLHQHMASGKFQPGSRLPSVRALEREFGINRNAAFKVYQELVDSGYVDARRGAGYYLIRPPREVGGTPPTLAKELYPLLWRARADGVQADEAIRTYQEVLAEVYATSLLRIGFVECTAYIARSISRELSHQLALRVEPLVLGDLLPRLREIVLGFDLLATTFFHLREIETAVADAGVEVEVIGLKHTPATSTVLQIARIPRVAKVGVICSNERTLRIAVSTVDAYHGLIDWVGTSGDEMLVEQVLSEADVLVTSADSHDHIMQLLNGAHRPEVIILNFDIESESMDHLRLRVTETLKQRLHISAPERLASIVDGRLAVHRGSS